MMDIFKEYSHKNSDSEPICPSEREFQLHTLSQIEPLLCRLNRQRAHNYEDADWRNWLTDCSLFLSRFGELLLSSRLLWEMYDALGCNWRLMMSPLPEEVIDCILSRLPVKSLLRFRSVCKSWRYSIDSPYFVKLHLKRSIEDGTNLSVLLMSKYSCIIGFDSVNRFTESGSLTRHPLNYTSDDGSVSVWGSCNGLFFLTWPYAQVLWNPATRESRELPILPTRMQNGNHHFVRYTMYGVGYDTISDDYKVVKFELRSNLQEHYLGPICYRMHFHDEVEVYSLKSNSWRTIIVECPHNSDVHTKRDQLLINGALHWLVSEQGIISFDFSLEAFMEVPHPPTDNSHSGKNHSKTLENLGGRLSVFFHNFDVESHVDIWVMKDYGVKESWTKLITITTRELGYSRIPAISYLRPIACSNSDDGILFQRSFMDLFWYDVERKAIKKIARHGLVYLVAYTESLVSLSVGAGAETEAEGDDVEQQQRG